ncbi:MAG: flavin-dependent monooxygenase QhpG [Sciscionella sp.]
MTTDDAEVCVIGAGPAGATLATRLAQLGHTVAIIEQRRFPREHIGDSLSPGVWPLLDFLGVGERVAGARDRRAAVRRVRWSSVEEERAPAEAPVVDRGAFDTILLERARHEGALVWQPAGARRPRRVGDSWDVPVATDRVLRARFVADATGRRRLLGGRRSPAAPRTLALYARWRGKLAGDGMDTGIEALADGWLWGARLPCGDVRVMAFLDPETLLSERRDLERLYCRLLGKSAMFTEFLAGAKLVGRVHTCDATSYMADRVVDARSVKVGEAALAIDPLSSAGVQTAIQTGLTAAAVVHTILLDGDTAAASRYYDDQLRHSSRRHAATAAALYAEHKTYADGTFWRRRSAAARPPAPQRTPAPLAELLLRPARLVHEAELQYVPCLVVDRVEVRRALVHPVLERPVAFLGGVELAPLIDTLQAAPSLLLAIADWNRSIPTDRAREITLWLHQRALIDIPPS